ATATLPLRLVQLEHLVGDELELRRQRLRVVLVLAAGEDPLQRLAAAAQLEHQPAHVAGAAVHVAAVGALDVADAPLDPLGQRQAAPLAEAVGTGDRTVLAPDLTLAQAARAGVVRLR